MDNSVQNGLVAQISLASALAGEPKDIAQVLTTYRPADAADVLNRLDHEVTARVLEAVPPSAAVQVVNESLGPAGSLPSSM
jgi:Mg/Co/Ni transporter MgtE